MLPPIRTGARSAIPAACGARRPPVGCDRKTCTSSGDPGSARSARSENANWAARRAAGRRKGKQPAAPELLGLCSTCDCHVAVDANRLETGEHLNRLRHINCLGMARADPGQRPAAALHVDPVDPVPGVRVAETAGSPDGGSLRGGADAPAHESSLGVRTYPGRDVRLRHQVELDEDFAGLPGDSGSRGRRRKALEHLVKNQRGAPPNAAASREQARRAWCRR